MEKWLIYQKERFPVLPYALMALTFSFSGIYLSSALRGVPACPDWHSVGTAFVVSLLLFAELRIADEFKDYETDCKHQPYRPVPRGLVSLKELGYIGIASVLLQLVVTAIYSTQLLPFLIATWVYLAFMSCEFFIGDFLRKRPLLYLLTHMPILLFLDTYITGCDWLVNGGLMPPQLVTFLAISFLNGIVIELGRKLRAPSDEEPGVETYSHLWGRQSACAAWLLTIVLASVFALITAAGIGLLSLMSVVCLCLLGAALAASKDFLSNPSSKRAKRLEALSSLWILSVYVSLGTIPAITRSIASCMR